MAKGENHDIHVWDGEGGSQPHKHPPSASGGTDAASEKSPPKPDTSQETIEDDERAPAGLTHETDKETHVRAGTLALVLGALGVVFGDIGTSPLYALKAVFAADHHAIAPTPSGVFGVIALVFWSLIVVVTVKYLLLIMRADNDGEGGIMALIALVQGVRHKGRLTRAGLIALGIFGASLFYGDGMITPAISMLSAVEGVEVVAPQLGSLVVPITIVIITLLFATQRLGTATMGRFFGPVMLIWFATLAFWGILQIGRDPGIVRALSPSYAVSFFVTHPFAAFIALGSVVLVVTGAEALYADMGHFGRSPIRRAWFFVAFPALTLNYLGQASLILERPASIANPFFLLVPEPLRIPMVVLATLATIIASQAVISGAFSVTRQAVQLGFLPRLTIRHTSAKEIGQVYAPGVNWGIFVAVLLLVVGFESSAKLAGAYGIAVTGTLAIDTLLFFFIVHALWKKPRWVAITGAAAFLAVDLAFFLANMPKVLHGGWFPIVIAVSIFTVLLTWQTGRRIVTANRSAEEGSLREFIDDLHRDRFPPVPRVPGTAIFLSPGKQTTPLALRANIEHNHVLHQTVVIVSIKTDKRPYVPEEERLQIDDLGYSDDDIFHIGLLFGFQDQIDVPRALELARETIPGLAGPLTELDDATYFLSKITIQRSDAPGLSSWRKRLFIAISRNAANPVDYFSLPTDRTVIMGSHISL